MTDQNQGLGLIKTHLVDVRREKRYGRSASVSLTLPDGVRPRDVLSRVKASVGGGGNAPTDYLDTAGWHLNLVQFHWFWPSRRPSDAISEEEARERVQSTAQAFQVAILDLEAEAVEWKRRQQVVAEVNRVARALGSYAAKQAKEAVRYDQRMAALVAEMEAEIAVQLAKLPHDPSVASSLAKSELQPETAQAAMQFAGRFTNGYRGFMFETTGQVQETDVFGNKASCHICGRPVTDHAADGRPGCPPESDEST